MPAWTVVETELPEIGGRRFFGFRSVVAPEAAGAWHGLVRAAYAALAEGFDPDAGGPVGLAVQVPPEEAARRPEAVWDDPRLLYAAAAPQGRQLRVAYFPGAIIAPRHGPPLDYALFDRPYDGPPVLVFGEQQTFSLDDVVAFWLREEAMEAEEARRRATEVLLVAAQDGEIAGVGTAYLQYNDQLGLPMWHGRAFVGAAHRRGMTGLELSRRLADVLAERFDTGRDRRAPGLILEVEIEALRHVAPEAWWPPNDMTFIGVNERGDDVRVRWFRGAKIA